MPPFKLNDQQFEDILRRRLNGESTTGLCREYKISRSTLGRALRDRGVKLKRDKYGVEKQREIVEAYLSGKDAKQLESEYDIEHHVVHAYVRRSGNSVRDKYDKREKNGDPYINALISAYKNGATARNLAFSLDYEHFEQLIDNQCFYCGKPPSNVFGSDRAKKQNEEPLVYNGIDRLDNTEGYVDGNVVSCCYRCNSAKSNMTLPEFRKWLTALILFNPCAKIKMLENSWKKIKNGESGKKEFKIIGKKGSYF